MLSLYLFVCIEDTKGVAIDETDKGSTKEAKVQS